MAYGFIPVKHCVGGVIRMNNFEDYFITSAYDTALYQGDPVLRVADGSIELATVGSAAYLGIFAGVEYKDSVTGDQIYNAYWPASQAATNIKAYVWDDPWIKFKVQADQAGTALAKTDIGTNCDHLAGTGSNVTKRSGVQLHSSDSAAADGQFRVVGSAQEDGLFTAAGTTMDVYVVAVEHFWLDEAGID